MIAKRCGETGLMLIADAFSHLADAHGVGLQELERMPHPRFETVLEHGHAEVFLECTLELRFAHADASRQFTDMRDRRVLGTQDAAHRVDLPQQRRGGGWMTAPPPRRAPKPAHDIPPPRRPTA